jgi:hypothetical protein
MRKLLGTLLAAAACALAGTALAGTGIVDPAEYGFAPDASPAVNAADRPPLLREFGHRMLTQNS